jgi:MoaA/NifB/PqqE/SkfB family radical SAM enzyme
MNLREKAAIAGRLLQARWFNVRLPLIVSWAVTNRCNLSCLYCGRWKSSPRELDTPAIFSIIDELKSAGTRLVSFTGGEPLLREDIGEIIGYCLKKGLLVNINSNGTLFASKAGALSGLYSVRFSLDGPAEVNDPIRGPGTFGKVMEAIEEAKSRKIKTYIATVLSKYNLDSVDYLVALAQEKGIGVIFQPSAPTLLNCETPNPHVPDVASYRRAIDKLIDARRDSRAIVNTMRGLKYLRDWPNGKEIFCYQRNISCRIESDGFVYHCGRYRETDKALNCRERGIKKAFGALSSVTCNNCWCALFLETNYMASLDAQTIASLAGKL